jgi:hypothetical protein
VHDLVGRYEGKVKFVVTDPTADLGDLPVVAGKESGLVLEDTSTGELRRSKESSNKITRETVESFLKNVHVGEAVESQKEVSEEKEEARPESQKAEETPRTHEEL